jgi:hypothetical protein
MKTRILFLCTMLYAAVGEMPIVHAATSEALESARVEFSASRLCVGDHEITGFSALPAQDDKLAPPAGLKPVEQEAWLAMARRQGGHGLNSFYPARYGEPFVVEGEGVRVAVRPVGGMDAAAQIDNGQVTYRNAYAETDSVHVVSAGRSEEFLFLHDECGPREFAYELSELSAGTRVDLDGNRQHKLRPRISHGHAAGQRQGASGGGIRWLKWFGQRGAV